MNSKLHLSVVIPALNEEQRIENTIGKLTDYFGGQNYSYEIIVIDDGSTDSTKHKVKEMLRKSETIKLIENKKNKGKGYAVKRGVLEAKGKFMLFTDADLSTPIEELDRFLLWMNKGYDIVIGSRGLPESNIIIPQVWYRQDMGKIFNLLVRTLFSLPFRDTQCGFKLFKGNTARALFSKQRVTGFAFDVEILYLARRRNIQIKEVPVEWRNHPSSKVHLLGAPICMLKELITIRINAFFRELP